jgi:guanylate kinase
VVVVSGPSGVGKDALLARIRERTDAFAVPVTMTTRPPRDGEVDGRDYIFVTPDEFANVLAAGELLEHAEVYGNSYGVPRSQLREALAAGRDVIMRVDVQGAATLRRLMPGAVFVFLAPPDRETLAARLRRRGDEIGAIERRLAAAERELRLSGEFEHVVVNADDGLERAVDAVLAIVEAERARPDRQPVEV